MTAAKLTLSVSLLLAVGCTTAPPYRCTSNNACRQGTLQGNCEPTGYCSFPDPMCPSHQRYGESAEPGQVNACTPDGQSCIVDISAGGTTEGGLNVGHTCVLKDDGAIFCWGDNSFGQLGVKLTGVSPVAQQVALPPGQRATALSVAELHTCALTAQGAVYCWGNNEEGQLGISTTPNVPAWSPTPLQVTSTLVAKAIGAGGEHSCLVAVDSTVWCWGQNGDLQVADRADDPQLTPVQVPGITKGDAVSAGDQHSCALSEDSSIVCWGSNALGQLGQGDGSPDHLSMPAQVKMLFSAVSVTLGDQHSCSLLNDSSVYCWGSNVAGSIGNGSMMNASLPVRVLDGVVSLKTSGDGKHVCAVKSNGTIVCWGNNDLGQLALDPATSVTKGVPTEVPLSSVKLVGVGAHHSCAATFDGTVWCWGGNHSGQLGIAPSEVVTTPQRAAFSCQ